MKKEQNYSPVLFKNLCKKKSKHLLSRTFFVDCFRYIERITEGKLKCLLHTALISNAFFDENKDKRKWYSLCLWRNEMEDSVFIKTEYAFGKFCFWLSISNFWQKQKQKTQVYGEFRILQICLSSSFCLIMDCGVGELRGL